MSLVDWGEWSNSSQGDDVWGHFCLFFFSSPNSIFEFLNCIESLWCVCIHMPTSVPHNVPLLGNLFPISHLHHRLAVGSDVGVHTQEHSLQLWVYSLVNTVPKRFATENILQQKCVICSKVYSLVHTVLQRKHFFLVGVKFWLVPPRFGAYNLWLIHLH